MESTSWVVLSWEEQVEGEMACQDRPFPHRCHHHSRQLPPVPVVALVAAVDGVKMELGEQQYRVCQEDLHTNLRKKGVN